MFKCLDCGHLFEEGEQAEWVEPHGETLQGCPKCRYAFGEIHPCKICGTYNHEIDDDFCHDCKEKTYKKCVELIEKNFSKVERELLEEIYDGGISL